MSESAFAQHIFASIRNELTLLKSHQYIQPQAYDDIMRILSTDASNNNGGRRDTALPSSVGYPAVVSSFAGGMPSPLSNMAPSPATASMAPPAYNAPSTTTTTTTMENRLGSAEALYDYNGENPSDLTMHRGDIIQLTELVNDDWWKGTLNGKTGIFPRNYVKKLEPSISEKNPNPPPPTPARNQQRASYGYSPVPAKQDPYSYPAPPSNYNSPPPQTQNGGYAPPPPSQNSYAPPVAQNNSYAPPPIQSQVNSYAPPPIQNQVNSYAPPPVQQVASTSSAPAAVEENKALGFGKKLAGNIGNAATWGFGATIGSDIAHSIF